MENPKNKIIFRNLFCVRSSLIFLYLALTLPITFITSENEKILSIILFLFGFILINNITNDYVLINETNINYKTTFLSQFLGKKNWTLDWEDIDSIQSFPTSQGSRVFYFISKNKKSFLIPQRLENFKHLLSIISNKTKLNTSKINYLSPLWTYKILTFVSIIILLIEIIAFFINYQH